MLEGMDKFTPIAIILCGTRETAQLGACHESIRTGVCLSRTKNKSRVWGHVLIILSLGRQRQADPHGLLASQPNVVGKLQANLKNKARQTAPEKGHPSVTFGLCTRVH